jgi:uncharacterized membrane protein
MCKQPNLCAASRLYVQSIVSRKLYSFITRNSSWSEEEAKMMGNSPTSCDWAYVLVRDAHKTKKQVISFVLAFTMLASLCLVLLLAPPSAKVVSASPATIGVQVSISADTWAVMRSAPAGVSTGGALVWTGGDNIYAFKGALSGGDNAFWRYSISTNTWDIMANAPLTVAQGGALVWTGGDNIYALRGNGKTAFWRYSISTNTWGNMENAPGGVGVGGALVWTEGDNIYAFRGSSNAFWRYSISTGHWKPTSYMPVAPATVGAGGALVWSGGDNIYAFQGGNNSNAFWLFSISENKWRSYMPVAPAKVGAGGALAWAGGDYIYAFQGAPSGVSNAFWRFSISENKWKSDMAVAPDTVGDGGALARSGGNYIYAFGGFAKSGFWRYSFSSMSESMRGGTLTYIVKVKNTGSVADDYTLTKSDNSSFGLTLLMDSTVTVPAGESRDVTLTVTIPIALDKALYNVWDDITVTATSPSVASSGSCKARAVPPQVPVVSISPDASTSLRGGTLSYTVTVTNPGSFSDTYKLENSGNAGWPLSIQSSVGPLAPYASEDVTLTVTIPYGVSYNVWDNITVKATSQADSDYYNSDNCGARAVQPTGNPGVSILPFPENIAEPGATVTFDVTITNPTTFSPDNFELDVSDNQGWTLSLDNSWLLVPKNENRTTTLTVTIPDNAVSCTRDNITVTATSQADDNFENSASCLAHSFTGWGVYVSVDNENSGKQGENVKFTVKVTNVGDNEDNYDLLCGSAWASSISPVELLSLPNGGSGTATLTVSIPGSASAGQVVPAWVKASSQSMGIYYTKWCNVRVVVNAGVKVAVSPSESDSLPRETRTYTITVTNIGMAADNYILNVSDNAAPSWGPTLSASSVLLGSGASGNVVLSIRVPDNATPGTLDNISVIARSKYDNTISAENSCTVRVIAIRRGVTVSISPSTQDNIRGGTLKYTVRVTNTGNVADNYTLMKSDDLIWTLSLSSSTLTIPAGENRTATLTVTIPPTAEGGAEDLITITATSRTDSTIKNSAGCIAHALGALPVYGVDVSISPSEVNGLPDEALTFTVTVTNTGEVDDYYYLDTTDDMGWGALLDGSLLTIPSGVDTTVTVSVTVPSDVSDGYSTMITVTAISGGNTTVSDSATCTATATGVPPPPSDIVPIAIGGAAIGGGVVVAVALMKGIIHLPSIHSRFLRLLFANPISIIPYKSKILMGMSDWRQ